MDDTGGNVPGGYNPRAEELFAEGLRITPLRIHAAGKPLRDVVDLLISNVRTGEQQRHDMGAQLASLQIAERNLLALVGRHGAETIRCGLDRILQIGEENMRAAIAAMPDGTYEGAAPVEDDGRSGPLQIRCRISISGDEMRISVLSPPQTRSYINSYWANTTSSIYYAVLMYAQVPPPYNEGLYRPISVDLGQLGTLTNARYPAPCSAATSTVGDNITDAARDALSHALPERAVAGWAHAAGTNQLGIDPRTNEFYNFNMIIGTSGGAGASAGLDGWHCLNIIGGGGGIVTGDVELLEHEYPVTIHRWELRADSAGAGRWRGGLGPIFEEEPDDHGADLVLWGEGFHNPAAGALGAISPLAERKVARKAIRDETGVERLLDPHRVYRIGPGEILQTCPPGGGGVGNSYERDPAAVQDDVRDGFVSLEAARIEYAVVLDAVTYEVDEIATARLRQDRATFPR
jgi:N-methylhydantoinase B